MTKAIEFSHFFRLLNSVKEGSEENKQPLQDLLDQYQSLENCDSGLHQLGQAFIYIGLIELFAYAATDDINVIGSIDRSRWEEMAKEKQSDLPPHLANTMIKHAKKEKLSAQISSKWPISKREVEKNIVPMARYITEGILDAID